MKEYNIFKNSKGDTYIFIPVSSIIKKIVPMMTESDKLLFAIQYNTILDGDGIVSQIMNMGQYIIDISIPFDKFDKVYVYSNISKENVHSIIDVYSTNIPNEIYYNDYVTSEPILTGDYIRSLSSAIYSTIGKFSKNGDVIIVKLLI